eukprot:TRINITY_DN82082_c0_g1_i1.p1 TRINITY_DN82082_c0_g1~~TRINITY_DN82082_c0_g1_i1.p1  ORF type:complete len:1161 (-),score=359.16 TRINITY_DN82082_c0_g1_i1:52-3534(-)
MVYAGALDSPLLAAPFRGSAIPEKASTYGVDVTMRRPFDLLPAGARSASQPRLRQASGGSCRRMLRRWPSNGALSVSSASGTLSAVLRMPIGSDMHTVAAKRSSGAARPEETTMKESRERMHASGVPGSVKKPLAVRAAAAARAARATEAAAQRPPESPEGLPDRRPASAPAVGGQYVQGAGWTKSAPSQEGRCSSAPSQRRKEKAAPQTPLSLQQMKASLDMLSAPSLRKLRLNASNARGKVLLDGAAFGRRMMHEQEHEEVLAFGAQRASRLELGASRAAAEVTLLAEAREEFEERLQENLADCTSRGMVDAAVADLQAAANFTTVPSRRATCPDLGRKQLKNRKGKPGYEQHAWRWEPSMNALLTFKTRVLGAKTGDLKDFKLIMDKTIERSANDRMAELETAESAEAFSDTDEENNEDLQADDDFDYQAEGYRENLWTAAFYRLADDRKLVKKENVPGLLMLCGLQCPDEEAMNEAIRSLKQPVLELAEYLRFARVMEEHIVEASKRVFDKKDVDNSETLDMEELGELLEDFGITPLPSTVREVVAEVAGDAEVVSREAFTKLLDIIRLREGFPRKEITRFRKAYKKFDHDHSGTMDADELTGAMDWLGYVVNSEDVKGIVGKVDVTGTGELGEREFLICLRNVHEAEVGKVKEVMKKICKRDDGTLSTMLELEQVVRALGYHPDRNAMLDAAIEAKLHMKSSSGSASIEAYTSRRRSSGFGRAPAKDVDFSGTGLDEIWRFLLVYRGREGFSTQEAQEIESAFERYDREGNGEMNCLEVGKVLRWFGYPTAWETQRALVQRVDVDNSGRLNVKELLKLIRIHREKDVAKMQEVFAVHESGGMISMEAAISAYKMLGYPPDNQMELQMLANQAADNIGPSQDANAAKKQRRSSWSGLPKLIFLEVGGYLRHRARVAFRSRAGYSSTEIEALKQVFMAYSGDEKRRLPLGKVSLLLEDRFTSLVRCAEMRPHLQKLLTELHQAAASHSSVDFPEFLLLMRQMQDLHQHSLLKKEEEAVTETRFSPAEVEEFRDLFNKGDTSPVQGGKTEITLDELSSMLGSVVLMGDQNSTTLELIFRDIVPEDDEERGGATFADFLRIMRRLMDTNFANIVDEAEAASMSPPASPASTHHSRSPTRARTPKVTIAGETVVEFPKSP